MPHIEFHIVDNCNLNCAGCSHFSPLFNGTKESFNEKIINVEKLLKKFSCIARLDILGGEPLLCKELDSYIIRLRELLPYTYMRIFTNGLLIPRISSNTFKIMRDNKIEFFVSEYAPTHKMITSIEETLKRERMRYTTSGFNKRSVFNICISINSNSVYPWCCISKGCYALGDGKIAKCPTLLYLHKFNEVFKQNLPTEGIIDIDNNMDGKRIIQLLESKVPLCDFCISKPIEWKSCKRPLIIEDFAAKE
ncbi:4Fe-4S cluster-binding domain-containing protein [Butyrivibrio sp. NC3005]|uniref:4Fe-4S cluster-binding domain-containing protein n=1 Tax=Butyrivibrio sp. NC3005 TaxID=1280685 RepID=UPI0003F932E5|nr:4Fe-4S cluster-binding domain-containing protein [Butyrivibrio sp. NC3005]